jgi:TonB family protein
VRGLLFEGLVVSARRGRRRPWVAMVSFGLHAAAFALVVVVPILLSSNAPVIARATPIVEWPEAPRVTLAPEPPPARTTRAQHAATAAPAPAPAAEQSVQVPTDIPDHLPPDNTQFVDPSARMVIGDGCLGCPPAPDGTPVGSGDAASASDGGGRPVIVGGDIQAPRKLTNTAPVYPPLALQARISGMVIVECIIDPRGHVTSARVLRGHPLLDAAAVHAVEQWTYEPTRLNGIPVAVQMTVTVRFQAK